LDFTISTADPLDGADAPAGERSLLFRAADRVYGIGLDEVREIIPWGRITRFPGAPPFVLGLVNLRGTIVTVIDLGRRLDPERAPAQGGSIMLVPIGGTRVVGVAVEQVLDVREVPEADGLAAHASAGEAAGLVRGVGHSDGQIVILLDIRTLVRQVLL
jgi:purine-binding chemotaxis protein CheW